MSEDDHKLIVETETVEAPVSSLLIASTATGNGNTVGASNGGKLSSQQNKDLMEHAIPSTALKAVGAGKIDTNSLKKVHSGMSTTGSSTIHEGLTSGGTIPGSNINLIDNNPLSPHITQASLRNKKSSLLIDSSINKSHKLESDEVPKTRNLDGEKNQTLRKHMDEIANANRDDVETSDKAKSGGHAEADHNISYSSHSSKTNTTIPTPLMLPVATNAIAGATVPPTSTLSATTGTQANRPNEVKSSKIIERPPISMTNSREILLEDEIRHKGNGIKSSSANNATKNSNTTKATLRDESANVQLNKSSTAHSDDLHHDLESIHKPTKADFFAARLASAVGENEISDSEETFIYESAANSTKNAVAASVLDQPGEHHPPQPQPPQQQSQGIPSKMSVPVLNSNAKLLSRLKNTRHTSMSALPISSSTKYPNNVELSNNNTATPLVASTPTIHPTSSSGGANGTSGGPNDELGSIISQAQPNPIKQMDLHSVKSFTSETKSPEKRLSLASLAKGVVPSTLNSTNTVTNNNNINPNNSAKSGGQGHTSRKPSISNSTLRHVSSSQAGTARGKYLSSNPVRPEMDNLANNIISGNKRNLRTTASKIFDANGAPLRRYSGVPDDVNLEDFIEQSNGQLMTNPNNNQRDERPKSYLETSHPYDKRFSHDTELDYRSAIQEEEGENDRDDDDVHSMFYYNHRGDLEARPQISDYEEDGEGLDEDNHDDKYYNYPYLNGSTNGNGNGYVPNGGNNNSNYGSNNNRQAAYFEYGLSPTDAHFHTNHLNANPTSNNNPHCKTNQNEQTPLKARKQFSRNQLSYSPHDFYTRKSSWARIKHCVYFTFIVVSLLTVGFILGFLLATNKELQGFNIVIMDNVLSSSDELLFDITVSAFNPGFFAVGVQDVKLDIFAKSGHIKKDSLTLDKSDSPSKETILLGTVYNLETPLKFEGGFFKRNYDVSVSSVKLLDPGSKTDSPDDDDDRRRILQQLEDDAAKWKALIQYEYELIVRGSMQYKIPFFRSNKSVAVQSSADVHPGKDGDGQYALLL